MNRLSKEVFDIAVVGGGLAGGVAAIALAGLIKNHGLTMVLCEKEFLPSNNDNRVLALSYGGAAILKKFGLWQTTPYPVTSLELSLFGSKKVIRSRELGLAVLGYTIAYGELQQLIFRRLKQLGQKYQGFSLRTPFTVQNANLEGQTSIISDGVEKIYANLILSAQGGQSQLTKGMKYRQYDIKENAWVMGVNFNRGEAERGYLFSRNGFLLALVPHRNSWTAILTSGSDRIDESECQRILSQLGCDIQGEVRKFPLASYQAMERVKGPLVLLGNAAYNIPPLGAQNYNLTLFTIYELHKVIAEHLNFGNNLTHRYFLEGFVNQSEREITQRIAWVNYMSRILRLRRQGSSLVPYLAPPALSLLIKNKQLFKKLLGDSWLRA